MHVTSGRPTAKKSRKRREIASLPWPRCCRRTMPPKLAQISELNSFYKYYPSEFSTYCYKHVQERHALASMLLLLSLCIGDRRLGVPRVMSFGRSELAPSLSRHVSVSSSCASSALSNDSSLADVRYSVEFSSFSESPNEINDNRIMKECFMGIYRCV